MIWTPEQEAVLAHPLDAHAVVRSAPGAGKTTTLVGRVQRLVASADPRLVRVVMFNKAVQETFVHRLGVRAVRVSTFDALGFEVLRVAERQGILSRPLEVRPELTTWLARDVFRGHRDAFDDPDEIERAVAFWKGHLVPPSRAAFPSNPALVEAYGQFEERRLAGDSLRLGFEDMVYTAVGVLRKHPRLLGRIDHLLVDEFQDVNPGRVELVQRLIHEGTSLMVVGDEDQGINEWCGGHPRYFRSFASTFSTLPTLEYRLPRTFRFGPELAEAATRMIAFNTERSPGGIDGGGAAGRLQPVPDVGVAVRELLAGRTAPSDIAVLYRGRTQGAGVLAAMIADGIPVHTEDVSLLRTGRGPDLALGYLRAATTEEPVAFDDAWAVVFAPERYIQKEAFTAQVRRLGRNGLRAVVRDRAVALECGQGPGGLRSLAELARLLEAMGRCKTAAAALDLLLDEVDVEEQIRARLKSEREQDTAIACFHALHALFRGSGVSPREAAALVAAIDPQRGCPPGQCVRACTIHKAKGLEWRHVFLPGLIEGACPAEERGQVVGTKDQPDGIPQSPWIEQERRIFYVGVTRAIEVCYLHAPGDAPSRFVEELYPPRPARIRTSPKRKGGAKSRASGPAEIVAALTGSGSAPQGGAMGWARRRDPGPAVGSRGRAGRDRRSAGSNVGRRRCAAGEARRGREPRGGAAAALILVLMPRSSSSPPLAWSAHEPGPDAGGTPPLCEGGGTVVPDRVPVSRGAWGVGGASPPQTNAHAPKFFVITPGLERARTGARRRRVPPTPLCEGGGTVVLDRIPVSGGCVWASPGAGQTLPPYLSEIAGISKRTGPRPAVPRANRDGRRLRRLARFAALEWRKMTADPGARFAERRDRRREPPTN